MWRLPKQLGIVINQLTSTLTSLYGSKHQYWRVGTSDGKQPKNRWDMMRDGHCVAIGWSELGDLSWLEATTASKETLRKQLEEKYPNTPSAIGKAKNQIASFVLTMEPRRLCSRL